MKLGLIFLIFIFLSCGKDAPKKSSVEEQSPRPLYASSEIIIHVFYENGAAPYTDNLLTLKLWDLLQINLDSLFEGRPDKPKILIPKKLDNMVKFENHSKSNWTIEEVLELSKLHSISDQEHKRSFNIFFLNGRAGEDEQIIGYHLSQTNVIAIFKDVIKTSGSTEEVSKYMEQATLIHELGHAFGLVNNGLPMISDHQDSEHGAHCKNQKCVMYYANEGASSMKTFALNSLTKGSVVMFGEQCLTDSRNYKKD